MPFQKKSFFLILVITLIFILISSAGFAKIEWKIHDPSVLTDKPVDITLSRDGLTAYVLCEKSILIYSLEDKKITDTLPLKKSYTSIAITPDETQVLVTDSTDNSLTAISVLKIYDIEVGESPIIGDPKAPVTLTVFLDLQCPYCARLFSIIEKVYHKYDKQVRIVIKHYPLRSHSYAFPAAIAVLATQKQGKYLQAMDLFFKHYHELSIEKIEDLVKQLNLNMSQFEKDVKDSHLLKIIEKDSQLAHKLQLNAVPALFINGKLVRNKSMSKISHLIDMELKNKGGQ